MIKNIYIFLVLILFTQQALGAGKLSLIEDAGTGDNAIMLTVPAAISSNVILTLPSDDGAANEVLKTDGSGLLSWTAVLANNIDGSGTANKICKFTPDGDTIGDSNITDDGTTITIAGTNADFTATNFQIDDVTILDVPNATSISMGGDNDNAGMGANNVVFGRGAGEDMSGTQNVIFGFEAGHGDTATNTGNDNVIIGSLAGHDLTSGSSNVILGYNSARLQTDANNVVSIGREVGNANLSGDDNVFVGDQAGKVTTSASNTIVGGEAGLSNSTGTNNTFIGRSSGLNNTTGNQNTYLGPYATSGAAQSSNTYIGYEAGKNTSSSNNVLVGDSAGDAGAGNNSTMMGLNSGFLATGDNNIFLGHLAGDATTTGSNNIVIGYEIDTTAAAASDEMNLGGVIFADLSTGDVGIGKSSPTEILHLQSETASKTFSWDKYASDANGGADFQYLKARGDASSPLVLVDGDVISDHSFFGHDGTDFEDAAYIAVKVDGTPADTATDMPGRFEFHTTPDGSDTPLQRLVIKNDGNIGIGTDTTPDARLDIEGDADEVQLRIEGHTTQTSNMVEVYKSDSSTLTTSIEQNGAVNRRGWLSVNKNDAQSFDGALEDIIWTDEIRKDDDYYSFTASSADITFDVAGWYEVSYAIGFDTDDGDNNDRQTVRVTPEIAGTDITRARQVFYMRKNGDGNEGSASASFIVNVSAADVLQFEVDCSQEDSATGVFGTAATCDFETIANEGSIIIQRIDD